MRFVLTWNNGWYDSISASSHYIIEDQSHTPQQFIYYYIISYCTDIYKILEHIGIRYYIIQNAETAFFFVLLDEKKKIHRHVIDEKTYIYNIFYANPKSYFIFSSVDNLTPADNLILWCCLNRIRLNNYFSFLLHSDRYFVILCLSNRIWFSA